MDLAYTYVAHALQGHDEIEAARINEHRRMAADREAFGAERVEFAARGGFLHRAAERLHLIGHEHSGAPAAH